MAENLFSPLPTGVVGARGDDGIFRSGKHVVTPLVATWPARCVVCNRDVPAADFKTTLVWYPRWTIFVFLLSRLIGLILMMIKRKNAVLHVGLCEEHRGARRRNLWIWGGITGLSVLALPLAIAADVGGLAAVGGIGLLAGIIGLAIVAKPLRMQKVEDEMAYVTAKAPFLASLENG